MSVRVRFAPSPTGPLHIGGVRTALYNYLFAKHHGGVNILRIEDTDQTRFVPGAEQYIIDSLSWLGITFDEGVHVGGPHAPYRQSERKELYGKYAETLVEKGFAYYAFDTPEELDAIRKECESRKETFLYGIANRNKLRNSLTVPQDECKQMIASGMHYVVRMKIPENEKIVVNDLIRGRVEVDTATLDDKVLFKSDGMPTYHLANVVDDYLMKITHVIRGEEWLPSAPLHVLLYRCLGWEEQMPAFAHLPLLLKPDGNGKLSKRDGDRLGFPVFPLEWKDPKSGEVSSGYRESGYEPEGVINMLALLGWNPGTEQEFLSMEELIKQFSLEHISKAGAKFDLDKAKWFNQHYLRQKPKEILVAQCILQLKQKGVDASESLVEKACEMVTERMVFAGDFWEQSKIFFVDPEEYDATALQKKWKPESNALLKEASDLLSAENDFSAVQLHNIIEKFCTDKNISMGGVMIPLRIAMVGTTAGPDLCQLMEIVGKENVLRRINTALEKIK
ncbi:MAG: glutamate--tRNA ligase [Bacteroidota bacterium]